MTVAPHLPTDVTLDAPATPAQARVLTAPALAFVADLARTFGPRVDELLARRQARQARYDAGELPDFLPETESVRAGDWTVAPLPADLRDRRVEITGPTDRKMVINALNSGARVFMADLEDSLAPTWANVIEGQANLSDAVAGTIRHEEGGKSYALNTPHAVLMVRPRGWHLFEKHVRVGGRPVPGGLFDFGLYFFHNARALLSRGTGPYFYLPKMQSHLEARLWNDVFVHAQRALGLPVGTIKATVLIETLPAAFEMDEILFELRDHSAGLNCGRWDYIFSFIKTHRAHAWAMLPDRGQVAMTQPFMRAYTQLVIRTCHRRNVHAIGGMSAYIPDKRDPEANDRAMAQVRADKTREVTDGHDGTWVAHPGLVPVALEIFDAQMPGPNQIDRKRADVHVERADLLKIPTGTRTEHGLRHNLRVGIQYLASWLDGRGCVPLYGLMEDAATAEISRTQIWQQIRHGATLDDGSAVTAERVRALIADETTHLSGPHLIEAAALFERLVVAETPDDFLTLSAYESVLAHEAR